MIAKEWRPLCQGLLGLGCKSCILQSCQTGIVSFCKEVNLDWRSVLWSSLNQDRCSGHSHHLLREFMNFILNFMFMTLVWCDLKVLHHTCSGHVALGGGKMVLEISQASFLTTSLSLSKHTAAAKNLKLTQVEHACSVTPITMISPTYYVRALIWTRP